MLKHALNEEELFYFIKNIYNFRILNKEKQNP